MEQIRRGELSEHIESATVIFNDTGESHSLTTKGLSAHHFFPKFKVGVDEIQLRLDWIERDSNGQPTLDADFYDANNGKKRKLKPKSQRGVAHHTNALNSECRIYEWVFEGFSRKFSVMVTWRAIISESCQVTDSCSAEIIRSPSGES